MKPHKYRARPIYADKKLQPCTCPQCRGYGRCGYIYCDKCKGRGTWKSPLAVYYFRSQLEFQCARTLQTRLRAGDIREWSYEKEKVMFDKFTTYRPDFHVVEKDGSETFIECKGHNYGGGARKIRLFLKCFPQYRLLIYTSAGTVPAEEFLKRNK